MRARALLLAAALLAPLAPAAVAEPATTYDVKIRWTEHGIPHIEARDYPSLGYGYGYAVASETICVLADTYTTVRAQRSRFFGPDAGYSYRANGSTVTNLNSDFFYQQIIDDKRVERLLSGPDAPRQEIRDGVRGYVDGYNRWLADVGGADGVTDPACKGKPWVTPITEMDAYRRFYQLALLASSGVAIDGIGAAQPPTPAAPVPALKAGATAAALREEFQRLAIGSNAVALGTDATDNGRGLLLGNPHFPWIGSERFFQAHLTIPDELDVAGGSLLGVPLVLIGHTAHQAWSHTVSTAYRFTPFQETLVPGSPTTYLYDGVPTEMTSREVTVDALVGGKLEKRSRTLWSTKHGPVFTSILGIPLPWTPGTAFAMGDANAPNFRYLNHFFEVNHAQSAREVLDTLKRNQGIPWVNTIAADDKGEALYADISVTPHVTDVHARTCSTAVGQATFAALRLPVLDGSRSSCEWGSDPDSKQPGTFGPSSMPSLIRDDYVTNSNDSYWLANPAQPLEGFAQIIGDERAERTTRTRSGLVMVAEELANGGRFSRQELQDLLYSNRQHSFELTRDDLLTMCRAFPGYAPSSNGPVATGNACDVLEAWDGTDNLDARGALLFRRFWTRAIAVQAAVLTNAQRAPVWLVPFDANDPVHTPRGLNVANPLVQRAFGDALADLAGAGIPLDARLGDWQVDVRPDGTRTPYHGGPGTLGVFNALNSSWNASKGYVGPLAHGSSFIQVVAFDGDGCPDARTILTYSQSTNPNSPHYADQTRLYSGGGWVTDRFCRSDVRDNAVGELHLKA
ncbi:MAG TPA: penicillin acylase family protein [Mycobacteriales bacterium]|jgi:acyl-homoserine-lactone acylase